MLPIFFTYSGWNAAAYLAGEMRDPGRTLPRGLLIGTALVTLLYVIINLILIASVPASLLSGSTTARPRPAPTRPVFSLVRARRASSRCASPSPSSARPTSR